MSIPFRTTLQGTRVVLRTMTLAMVVAVCVAAAPAGVRVSPADTPPPNVHSGEAMPFTVAGFETLCRTDAIAAYEMSLAKFQSDVQGYRCTLQKQERVHGTLGEVEIITHAVREEPFSVTMRWEQGGGSAKATLYVRGENGGRMKVKTRFLLITDTDPNGLIPRNSSRYSIEDAGLFNSMTRTLRAMKTAKEAGTLQVEFLVTKAIAELNGRVCHVLKRTCTPAEVDGFRMSDASRNAAEFPKEAFTTLTIMLDAEHGLQVGSELRQADGTLIGAYYFRDLQLNPVFAADQFTPAVLKR